MTSHFYILVWTLILCTRTDHLIVIQEGKRTHANTTNFKGACNEAILFHNLQLSYSSITNWQLIFATKLQPNDRFVWNVANDKHNVGTWKTFQFFKQNSYFQHKYVSKYRGVSVHNYPTKKQQNFLNFVFANVSINICLRVRDPWQAATFSNPM